MTEPTPKYRDLVSDLERSLARKEALLREAQRLLKLLGPSVGDGKHYGIVEAIERELEGK